MYKIRYLVEFRDALSVGAKERGQIAGKADVSNLVAVRNRIAHGNTLNLAVNVVIDDYALAHVSEDGARGEGDRIIQRERCEHVAGGAGLDDVVSEGGNLCVVRETRRHYT